MEGKSIERKYSSYGNLFIILHLLLSAHFVRFPYICKLNTFTPFTPTQNDESEAVRTIRIACELFGPRGDQRNGYAIQVYWGKFPIYHHIMETDLITFLRVL